MASKTANSDEDADVVSAQSNSTMAANTEEGHRWLSSALRKPREVHYDRRL
jgi:hypothetical protein